MAAIVLWLLAPAAAWAADPAEEAYRSAMELADHGDLGNSRRLFERAFALSPRWKYAINAAKLALLERDLLGADRWLARAGTLAGSPAERQKSELERSVAERMLDEAGYGRLEVTLPAGGVRAAAALAGRPLDTRDNGFVTWALAGRHLLQIDVEGCATYRAEILMQARDRMSRVAALCAPGEVTPGSSSDPGPVPAQPEAPTPTAASEGQPDAAPIALAPTPTLAAASPVETRAEGPVGPQSAQFRGYPLVRLAGAAALATVALGTYLLALDRADAARAVPIVDDASIARYAELKGSAETWRWVALATALGGAGLGVWAVVDRTHAPESPTVTAAVLPGAHGAWLALTGRW